MSFISLEDRAFLPFAKGTTPQGYVRKYIGEHPELVPESVAEASEAPKGPAVSKRSRAALALQGLAGIK